MLLMKRNHLEVLLSGTHFASVPCGIKLLVYQLGSFSVNRNVLFRTYNGAKQMAIHQ